MVAHTLISLIIPTRNRVAQLKRLLASIEATAADMKNVDVQVRADVDDKETWKFLAQCNKPYLHYTIGSQPTNLAQVQNELWNYAEKSEYHWLLNDDVEIVTPNWVEIIRDRMTPFHLGRTSPVWDGYVQGDEAGFSEFPVVGAEASRALGYLMSESFSTWDCEVYLHKVYHLAALTCDLRDIKVKHHRIADATRQAMASRYQRVQKSPVQDVRKLVLAHYDKRYESNICNQEQSRFRNAPP